MNVAIMYMNEQIPLLNDALPSVLPNYVPGIIIL